MIVPAFSDFVDFKVAFAPVTIDTPVTISAAFGGATVASTLTIRAPVEVVKITKAEYVISKGQLKVEATSANPAAAVILTNQATGGVIGTMTLNGASGAGAKFSFQGTVPRVFVSVGQKSAGRSIRRGVNTRFSIKNSIMRC